MRDPKLKERLEIRRLDAVCTRQEAQIALMRQGIDAAVQAYRDGSLGHQQVGEMMATTQHNGGHQLMALLSRLMMLYKVAVSCSQSGEYGKMEEALSEVSLALQEGFYE